MPAQALPQPPEQPLEEIETTLNLSLPADLRSFLADRGINTLDQIREKGGLSQLDDLPVPANHPAVEALEAHSRLNKLSPDIRINQALIDGGYTSVADIANAPRAAFVNELHEKLGGDFQTARLYEKGRAQNAYLSGTLTGLMADWTSGLPSLLPWIVDFMPRPFEIKCQCEDCKAAVSQFAYLTDLLKYAVANLRRDGSRLTIADLSEQFGQPFGELRLPESCDEPEQTVRQVRIAIEVLRHYLDSWEESDGERSYLESAYTTLLQQIGTSYDELRAMRITEATEREELRKRLSERLGIPEDNVLSLRLDLETGLSEDQLETLFGLRSTKHRDVLVEAPSLGLQGGPTPLLQDWRLAYLKQQWEKQDWPEEEPEGAPPLIDPDLIGPADLKDPVEGNRAYDLWSDRRVDVSDVLGEIASRTATDPSNAVDYVLAAASLEDLRVLRTDLNNGKDVEAEITDHGFTLPAFRRLLAIADHHESGGDVLDSEWVEFNNILVQAWKQAQRYKTWREKEENVEDEPGIPILTLNSDYFRLADKEPELTEWRASRQARRTWRDRLETRIDQQQSVVVGLREAIDATEEATLELLRDRLIERTTISPQALTGHLLIDFETSTCHKTTRVSQAIATIQGLLSSARTGQLAESLPDFRLINRETFDQEWKWLGSYAPWRSAMFVYMYPENILLPHLQRRQTPGFCELVDTLRNNQRLTPRKACEAAARYADYFRDVSNLDLKTAVLAKTVGFEESCRPGEEACHTGSARRSAERVYLFARGDRGQTAGQVYVSSYEPGDDSPYAQSFWTPVPALGEVIDVVGAAAYEIPGYKRQIYLFVNVSAEGVEKLKYTTFDLTEGRWTRQVNELGLPEEEIRKFTAVVKQRNREDEPPHLSIRASDGDFKGAIYARHLNREGNDWEEKDWECLVGPRKGQEFGALHAMIEPAPDEFYLFVTNTDSATSHLSYRLFGDYDDGKWRRLYREVRLVHRAIQASYARSWLGGFPLPSSDRVYVFWGYGSPSSSGGHYQALHRSTEFTTEYFLNDIYDFDAWLKSVAGVSLGEDLLISDSSEFDGLTFLEFFKEIPKEAKSPDQYRDAVTKYINELRGRLDSTSDPRWKDWQLADRLIEQLSREPRSDPDLPVILRNVNKPARSLTDALRYYGYRHVELMAHFVPIFKKRIDNAERSEPRSDIPFLRRAVYGTGSAPASTTDRFSFERAGDRRGRYRSRLNAGEGNRLILSSPSKIAPTVDGPFDMTQILTSEELQERRERIQTELARNEDAPSAVQTYLREAWYSVPIHLALQLQKRREFTAALDWFRTVYDYGHEAGEPPDIYAGLVLDRDVKRKLLRPGDWLEDPLNPHAIAANRLGAYIRFTLISIIRCLLDYADAEFTRDNAESVPRARALYMTALKLLDLPETKQLLDRCEGPARLLDPDLSDKLKDSLWDEPVRGLQDKLLDIINNLGTVEDLADDIREMIEPDRSPASMYKDIRTRIDEVASQQLPPPTVETAIATQEGGLRQIHSALLSNTDFAQAVERIGGLAAQDFTGALTRVVDKAQGEALPWLRGSSQTGVGPVDPNALDTIAEPIAGNALSNAIRFDSSRNWNLFGEDMWRAFSDSHPADALELERGFRLPFIPSLNPEFCMPPNPLLRTLRLRAELNLEKIRNCRNIAGQERQLPPYAASTDATSGLPTINASGTIVVAEPSAPPPTPFRYEFLIQRARQLADRASQMEAAFLAALEKRDNEYYKLIKAKQDVQLSRARVRLQDLRVWEAEDNLVLAELQKDRAEIRAETYGQWLNEGISGLERSSLALLGVQAALQAAASATYAAASAQSSASVGVLLNSGAESTQLIAASLSSAAASVGTIASILARRASYERRRQRWQLQHNLARQDVRIGNQRIAIAQDQVQIVKQERDIADMEADFAEDIVDFLATGQFTTADLYEWMSGIYERVYGYFLQEATAVAKMAERQLAFERQEAPSALIQADYWEAPSDDIAAASDEGTDRRGLTGSARLLADIERLAQHRIETEQRKLQLSKTISLARLDPIAFQRFRETGVMQFETPLEMFDEDFPGHYLRLIKRVRVSVFALIPPTEGIHATLSSPGLSRVVTKREGSFWPVTVHRSPESIALSSPQDATGLFEMTPQQPELLRPFEGMGVDTTWELRMPKASNRFDFQTITEVLFTIDHTAFESFDYRRQVIRELDPSISADQPFSFRHQLADQWYDLHNPERTATPMEVSFTIRREDFPPNIENLKIQQLALYFALAEESSFELPITNLSFEEQGTDDAVGGEATPIDGIISTRQASAFGWREIIEKSNSPFGKWILALPEEIKSHFKNEEIDDMLFVITYEGRTPEWPP